MVSAGLLIAAVAIAADLQQAIDNAPAGSHLQLEPGTYHGHFTIRKPLVIEGNGKVVLDGNGKDTVLSVEDAADVTVSGLVIRNSGDVLGNEDSGVRVENSPRFAIASSIVKDTLFGIQIRRSPDAVIKNCQISGFPLDLGRRGDGVKVWYSAGTRLEGNTIRQTRDTLLWYSEGTLALGNSITDSRYGIHYMYSPKSVAEENHIFLNSVGIYVMYSHDVIVRRNRLSANRGPSGMGVAFKDSDRFKILDNDATDNRVGVYLDNSPLVATSVAAEMSVAQRNRIARNDVGVAITGPGEGALFRQNDMTDNWQQVSQISSNDMRSSWEENYWSDYAGVDPDRSGFGAIPYHAGNLVDSITDRYESFRVFNFGPAILALEFAERAVPWLAQEQRASDSRPSVRPWIAVPRTTNSRPFLALALAMAALVFVMRKVALP